MTEAQGSVSTAQIGETIARVRERIAAACERAGRDPTAVTLIGISKTHSADAVSVAYAAGLRDLGENRIQEAAPKIDDLRDRGMSPTWHMIGNLQRNKVSTAIGRFAYIHSVDSERLAVAISERASTTVRVFIEVNVAGEASKKGVVPEAVQPLVEQVRQLPSIDVIGLMTVAPIASDSAAVRPVFRRLRELRDATGLAELSMGMTDDFEIAIEEGATFVRVGRAIFGARPG